MLLRARPGIRPLRPEDPPEPAFRWPVEPWTGLIGARPRPGPARRGARLVRRHPWLAGPRPRGPAAPLPAPLGRVAQRQRPAAGDPGSTAAGAATTGGTARPGPDPGARRGPRLRPRPVTPHARGRPHRPPHGRADGPGGLLRPRHGRAARRAAAHRGLPGRGGRRAGRAAGDRDTPPPCCGPRPPRGRRRGSSPAPPARPAGRAAPAPGRTHLPRRRQPAGLPARPPVGRARRSRRRRVRPVRRRSRLLRRREPPGAGADRAGRPDRRRGGLPGTHRQDARVCRPTIASASPAWW